MGERISCSCKFTITCGLCGKELVVFMKKVNKEVIEQLDDPGDEIQYHFLQHWFNRDIDDIDNVIRLKIGG